MYEKALKLKHEENEALDRSVKTIERRWKHNTKEAHKFTAKPILRALRLRSLEEYSLYFSHAMKATRRGERGQRDAETLTAINDTRFKIHEFQYQEDKETSPERIVSKDVEIQTIPTQSTFRLG